MTIPRPLRRWGPWIAIVVVVVVAGVVGIHRPSHLTVDQRAASLANQVRCPVCDGETAAQSDTPPSLAIRSEIRGELAAGESPAHILAGLADEYGPGILEKPQAKGIGLLVWLFPVVVVAAAVIGLTLAFRRWRPAPASSDPTASDTDRELVDRALHAGGAGTGPAPGPEAVSRPEAPTR